MSEQLVEGVHRLYVNEEGFIEVDESGNWLIINSQTQDIFSIAATADVANFFGVQLQEEPNKENEPPEDDAPKEVWTRKMTWLLIREYGKLKDNFRNPKIKNKDLWIKIQATFNKQNYNISCENLDRKFRNLKKTFKVQKEKSKKSGEGCITWEFFDELDEIFHSDATVNFPSTVSSLSSANIARQLEAARPGTSLETARAGTSAEAVQQEIFLMTARPGISAVAAKQENFLEPAGVSEEAAGQGSSQIVSLGTPLNFKREQLSSRTPSRKRKRETHLNDSRRRQLDIEAQRVEELKRIRIILEQQLQVQRDRNEILKNLVKK